MSFIFPKPDAILGVGLKFACALSKSEADGRMYGLSRGFVFMEEGGTALSIAQGNPCRMANVKNAFSH